MLSIFIDNLLLDGFIGVHPHEMGEKQKILIDCQVWFERQKISQDKLQSKPLLGVLNYSEVVNKIEILVCKQHWYLLEDLAQAIGDEFLKEETIYRIRIKLNKNDISKKADKIGIIFESSA